MDNEIACTLTSAELRHRRATVLRSLQTKIVGRTEFPEGYSFAFPGDDAVIDELLEFIKTERECCKFFQFDLSVNGDKSGTLLRLTGPPGVKDFIRDELGFLA